MKHLICFVTITGCDRSQFRSFLRHTATYDQHPSNYQSISSQLAWRSILYALP